MEIEIGGADAAVVLAFAGTIAALVGVVKTFAPAGLPRWVPPVLALILSVAVVVLGRIGGEVSGTPLEVTSLAVSLWLQSMGGRELFRKVIGDDALRLGVARSDTSGAGGFPTGDSSR